MVKSPVKSIRLDLPVKLLKGEIQDSIWVECSVITRGWRGVVGGREIQDSIAFFGARRVAGAHETLGQKLHDSGP